MSASGPIASGRRGIALLSVLWVLTLLALMAATFTRTTRTETSLARNLLDNARAEALADAGVHLAAVKLLEPPGAGGWSIDGEVQQIALEGGSVRIVIADEGGKIDLNAAADNLIDGLLRAIELDAGESAELTAAVVDFRDPDGLLTSQGAEDGDYAQAGYEHDAKDGPFESVSELRQVLGMTAAIYEQLAPVLTIHTRRPLPDRKTAPSLVLAAIDGRGALDLAELTADLTADLAIDPTQQPEPETQGGTPDSESGANLRSRISMYAIHAEGRTDSGAVYAREAVLRMRGGAGLPYIVLSWQQGRRVLFTAGAEADLEESED
jgi:general secretion pathway protein K